MAGYAGHSRIKSVAVACDENAAFVAAKPIAPVAGKERSCDVSATRIMVLYRSIDAHGMKDGVEVLPVTHFMRKLVARR